MATHVGEGFDGPARHNPAAEPGQPTAGTFALDPHWVEQLGRHAICSPRA